MLSKRRQTHKNIYYTVLFTRSIRTGKTNLWRQKAESVCSEVGGLTVRASHELSRVMAVFSILWVIVTQASKLISLST